MFLATIAGCLPHSSYLCAIATDGLRRIDFGNSNTITTKCDDPFVLSSCFNELGTHINCHKNCLPSRCGRNFLSPFLCTFRQPLFLFFSLSDTRLRPQLAATHHWWEQLRLTRRVQLHCIVSSNDTTCHRRFHGSKLQTTGWTND